MGSLILLRHGETEWSKEGKHTGRTDVPLTPVGCAAAAALAPLLVQRDIVAVFTSPAQRAIRTADLKAGDAVTIVVSQANTVSGKTVYNTFNRSVIVGD